MSRAGETNGDGKAHKEGDEVRRTTNQPTNRLTNQPTDQQGEYSAICLFEGWKVEGRVQRFAI